jgi:hypothetical protein
MIPFPCRSIPVDHVIVGLLSVVSSGGIHTHAQATFLATVLEVRFSTESIQLLKASDELVALLAQGL